MSLLQITITTAYRKQEIDSYQLLLTEVETWLKTINTPNATADSLDNLDESSVLQLIKEHKHLIEEIHAKQASLDELTTNCDSLQGHSDVRLLAQPLSEHLSVISQILQHQITVITTNIHVFETHLQRLREQPESIQSVTLGDDTLASIEMPSHEVADDEPEKESEVFVTEVAPVVQKTVTHIETQTSKSLREVVPAAAQPIDVEQQTSFPIVEAPSAVDTQDHSMQTIKERKPTENITVTQTYTQDGHETIQFESGPNPMTTESVQDVFVDATYHQVQPGQVNRSSELLLRNVPQTFETTFVEPNETTTEVIVDADGNKRIIVRKLTQTVQQVTQHQQHQQFTTVSTLVGDDMVPVSESVSQINVQNQRTTGTTFGDTGSKTTVVSQEKGSFKVGTSPEMTVVHEYETAPLVEEFETTHPALAGSSSQAFIDSEQLIQMPARDFAHEESSSIQTVVQQVTRKVIQRRRRIIKRVVIIDGQEHVTEEIIDEPDEVEITEEEVPQVKVNIVKVVNGKTVVTQETSSAVGVPEAADEHIQIGDAPQLPSQVFEHIFAAPVDSITSHPEAPVNVIHDLDHSAMQTEGIVEQSAGTLDVVETIELTQSKEPVETIEEQITSPIPETSSAIVEENVFKPTEILNVAENIEIIPSEQQEEIVEQQLPSQKPDELISEVIIIQTTESLDVVQNIQSDKPIQTIVEHETSQITEQPTLAAVEITNIDNIWPEKHHLEDLGMELSATRDEQPGSPAFSTTPSDKSVVEELWPTSMDTGAVFDIEHYSYEIPAQKVIETVDDQIQETVEVTDSHMVEDVPIPEVQELIQTAVKEPSSPIELSQPIEDQVEQHKTLSVKSTVEITVKSTTPTESTDEPEPVKPVPTPRTQKPITQPNTTNLDVRSATQLFLDHEALAADPTTQTFKVSLPSSGNQSPGTVTVTMTKTGDEETPGKVNVHITEKHVIAVEPEAVAAVLTEFAETSVSEDSKRSRKKRKRKDKTPDVSVEEVVPTPEPIEVQSPVDVLSLDPSVAESVELNVEDDNTLSDLPEIVADAPEEILQEKETIISPDESYKSLAPEELDNSVKIIEESVISSASTSPKPLHSELIMTTSVLEQIDTEDIEQQTSPTNEETIVPSVSVSLDIRSTQTSPEERKEVQHIDMQTSPEPAVEHTTSEAQTRTPPPLIEAESQTIPTQEDQLPTQQILTKSSSETEVQTDDVNIVEATMTVVTTDSSNQTIVVDTREKSLQTTPAATPSKPSSPVEDPPTEEEVRPVAERIVQDILDQIPVTVDTSTEATNTESVTIIESETQTSLEPISLHAEPDDVSVASSSTITEEPYEIKIEATLLIDEDSEPISHEDPVVIEVQKSFVIDESGMCREEDDENDDKDGKKKKKKRNKKKKGHQAEKAISDFLQHERGEEEKRSDESVASRKPDVVDGEQEVLAAPVVSGSETIEEVVEQKEPTTIVIENKIIEEVVEQNEPASLTPIQHEMHLTESDVPIPQDAHHSPRRVELTITTKHDIFEPPVTTQQLVQSSPLTTSNDDILVVSEDVVQASETEPLVTSITTETKSTLETVTTTNVAPEKPVTMTTLDDKDLIISTVNEPSSNLAHDICPIEQPEQSKPKLAKLTLTKTTISDSLPQTKPHKTKPTTSVTIEEAQSPTEELYVPLTPGLDSADQYEPARESIWTASHQIQRDEPIAPVDTDPSEHTRKFQWTTANTLVADRIRNIGTLRSTHLSNVLHLATLSENVTEEPIENRIEALRNNVDTLAEALDQKDATVTQTTVISIIETVSTWLETIEYRVYLIRQQSSEGPSEEKVKALTDLSSELQHIAENVQQVAQQIKHSKDFVDPADKKRMTTCFQTLQSQVKAVEEITKENEEEALQELSRWNEYIKQVEQVIVYVHILQERFTTIISEDISIEEKLFMLDELELANQEHTKDISKLLGTARAMARDFPDKKIPEDIYATQEVAKNLDNNVFLERSRLMELQSLAEEYEQTLKEFEHITILADSLVGKPIVATTLDELQQEIQKHRKFFVNLNHCLTILESLEVNLDRETREKHAAFHKTLHDRASNLLDKAHERAQRLSLAASRWTVLEKGMREERQWLQVAQQRVPDLSAVTSADYDRYMTMYQSLSTDIAVHYAKQVHLTNQATKLQELCETPNIEDENNDSLAVLLRLRDEVALYLRRLQSFSETWSVYDSMTDRLELWIKDAERDINQIQMPRDLRTQPIENMRQFWEVKVHYEVHNNIRTTVGLKLEQALQILPLADEMLQRQFHSQLEERWENLTAKINNIQTSIVNSISAQDMSIQDKLAMLERELKEVQLNITSAKGVIKNEDELNLYIERMQVLKSRISIIGNELGRIGMLPATEPEHIGDLFGLSHRISTQIADELEGASILKDRLIAIQQGIDRIRHQQDADSATLDECEAQEKLGSENVEQAMLDCQTIADQLIGQWQQIMELRQLLHTLPMRLRVAVSPVKLERDISLLQDDHALLESRCSNIISSLRNRLALWRRFERQLEMVQQSVHETDYMMELLKVNGTIDYERLLKATERLEVRHLMKDIENS